jgi:Na+/H+-dicarboxylate symporter
MKLSLTTQCLIALLAGILAGTVALQLDAGTVAPVLGAADTAVRIWTNALRVVVLPLLVAQLFVAVSSQHGAKGEARKLGGAIPLVFFSLMAFTAVVAILTASGLLAVPPLSRLAGVGLEITPPPTSPAPSATNGSASWVDGIVPSNLFAAASADAILALMLFSLLFALAVRRLEPDLRKPLITAFTAIRDAMLILVGWLVLPAAVLLFAIAFRFAARSGIETAGWLLAFVGLAIVVLVVCILVLYPLAAVGGGISVARFARAVFPAQIAAFATRSSVATVPILLRDSERVLGVPAKVSALVYAAGAATLKLSQSVTPPLRLLFMAMLLRIPLSPAQIAVFVITSIMISPSVPGVPRVIGVTTSLPLYIAAGIPAEYALLLGPANAMLDNLLTMINTTGYMTANVLVARVVGVRSAPVVVAPARREELAGEAMVTAQVANEATG